MRTPELVLLVLLVLLVHQLLFKILTQVRNFYVATLPFMLLWILVRCGLLVLYSA